MRRIEQPVVRELDGIGVELGTVVELDARP
jgi:hypothetical protein